MEEKDYKEKSIIERHTLEKGFSLTGALSELDARNRSLATRVELLEATLLEYFESRSKPHIITKDSPKIDLI